MVLLEGCVHKEMAEGRWAELSLAEQMGNIGSEVSRALAAKRMGNEKRFQGAFERALELFDLTMECLRGAPGRLKEVCRAREEFCGYFLGDEDALGVDGLGADGSSGDVLGVSDGSTLNADALDVDVEKMMKYYNDFAALARARKG